MNLDSGFTIIPAPFRLKSYNVFLNNGQLHLQTPPPMAHANCQDQKHGGGGGAQFPTPQS